MVGVGNSDISRRIHAAVHRASDAAASQTPNGTRGTGRTWGYRTAGSHHNGIVHLVRAVTPGRSKTYGGISQSISPPGATIPVSGIIGDCRSDVHQRVERYGRLPSPTIYDLQGATLGR